MMIELRPARQNDYRFAISLYFETMKPYASVWMQWVDAEQELRFAHLWRPEDTRIIVLDRGPDVGWLEFSEDAEEMFLKQLYVTPAHQGRGIGSSVMTRLLEEAREARKPIRLSVLKNNPALRLYERLGFAVVGETEFKFLMRR